MCHDRLIFVAIAALLLASLVIRSRPDSIDTAPAASDVSVPATGYVRITGAVKHPGMYSVAANMMAIDVIKMAVPVPAVTDGALSVFAATPVSSGDAVDLTLQPDGKFSLTRGVIPVAERLVMGIPLDINTMNEADFDRLPGIGPATAKRIIDYRQNNGGKMSHQDLASIEGIGEMKFSALIKYFK